MHRYQIQRMRSFKTFFRNLFMIIIMFSFIMITILSVFQSNYESKVARNNNVNFYDDYEVLSEYLLEGENCKIPNLTPFSKEAMSVFESSEPKKCSNISQLTSIEYSIDGARLIIKNEFKKHYLSSWWQNEISCCYQQITRSENNDNDFTLSKCTEFVSGHLLNDKNDEYLLVTCKGFRNISIINIIRTEVYKDAHAVINTKEHVEKKLIESNASESNKINVLFIGIDSISRLNFIRAMPSTHKYLKMNNWIEMKAFNKVGDNTFPNFVSILGGLNDSYVYYKCSPKLGNIDKCTFLWNDFNDANYATAYAEDSMEITTFNLFHNGFTKQPTDYYFRPFGLAVEKHLKTTHEKPWYTQCVGYQHYADYIYNYAIEYAEKYQSKPHFGFFWTNSFSHDNINMPSEYDLRMTAHFETFEKRGLLNDTIVIFFSDHGMRFGDIRKYYTGWLEERLPFLHFWLPDKFKIKYPEFAENLKINADRLISPFDVYITVKHILQLSGAKNVEVSANGCAQCQSLFYEVSQNRSCEEAAIPKSYCACKSYNEIDHSLSAIRNIASFVINEINSQLESHKNCAQLKLNNVISARQSDSINFKDYLISFDVLPSKGEMEATVRCDEICTNYELIGEVSRINRYGNQSRCINDSYLRKFCYCI